MKNNKESSADWLIGSITNIFIIYMVTFYPLVLNNKYFDVTITKFTALKNGIIAYVVFFLIAVLLKFFDGLGKKNGTSNLVDIRRNVMLTDFFMLLYLIAGFAAWLMAKDRTAAMTGEEGRRCGFFFMMLIVVMYFAVSYKLRMKTIVPVLFAITSIAACSLGILQFFLVDMFHLTEQLANKQKMTLISTFGNVNTFSGFVIICIGLFMGLYIVSNSKWRRCLYGVALVVTGGATIACISDSIYMGLTILLVVGAYVSTVYYRFGRYVQCLIWWLLGYVTVSMTIGVFGVSHRQLKGITSVAEHPAFFFCFLVLLIVLQLLMVVMGSTIKEETEGMLKRICKKVGDQNNCRIRLVMLTIIVLFMMAIGAVYTRYTYPEFFKFDKHWGSYRGYIWSRLIGLYNDFPILNKIFGNGNESVKALMSEHYYDEMKALTKTVYDNAHNEILQYLVTTGLVGAISFVGIVVSAIRVAVKGLKENLVYIIYLLGIIAYFAQAMVNVNQAITSPMMYLMVACVIGQRRFDLTSKKI